MIYQSPIGPITLTARDGKLAGVYLHTDARTSAVSRGPHASVLDQTARDLDAYFKGTLQAFDLPLHFGGTAFQNAVWQALCTIPRGQTWSYAKLAQAIGRPSAVRAVGAANGQNPIAIVVPCHRVIGANGTLTGYAGGLEAKRWLLEHERGERQLRWV